MSQASVVAYMAAERWEDVADPDPPRVPPAHGQALQIEYRVRCLQAARQEAADAEEQERQRAERRGMRTRFTHETVEPELVFTRGRSLGCRETEGIPCYVDCSCWVPCRASGIGVACDAGVGRYFYFSLETQTWHPVMTQDGLVTWRCEYGG
jgi:hypothetical protein